MMRGFGEDGFDQALSASALEVAEVVQRAVSSVTLPSGALDPRSRHDGRRGAVGANLAYPYGISVQRQREVILACMDAYYECPHVRNIFDWMSTFGSSGVKLVAKNKRKQRFYDAWAKLVCMGTRTERFMSLLLRGANVFVRRRVAKMTPSEVMDMQRGIAGYRADDDYVRRLRPRKNEIPIDYTFLHPAAIETAHGQLAAFLGKPCYILRLPGVVMTSIKTPKSPTEQQLVDALPSWVRDPVLKGEKFIYLDNDMVKFFSYMRDDWQQFAVPIAYSILPDVSLYKKLKQADDSMLDGLIGRIRLWTLGNVKEKIQPGPDAMLKLQELLTSIIGGGSADIVWDDTLKFQESNTDTKGFLGEEKYYSVYRSINVGLGMPQSGSGKSEGYSADAINIKTLIERLVLLRTITNEFWRGELDVVQEAIGDTDEVSIVYDNNNIYEEAAEKMIWVQLYDRGLVSDETIQENMGMLPQVEQARIKRDMKARQSGRKTPKAGPFDTDQGHEMEKIALQQGTVAPTEVGVKKQPRAPGDKSLTDVQIKTAKTTAKAQSKKKGQPGKGRPRNSSDTKPRKKRQDKPKTSTAELLRLTSWARGAQRAISEAITPAYLSHTGKKNVRSLSNVETEVLERLRFKTLMGAEPFTEIRSADFTEQMIASLLASPESTDSEAESMGLAAELLEESGLEDTTENRREVFINIYAMLHQEGDE